MTRDEVMRDVQALAGRFPHRGSNTENERGAAEYIQQRMRGAAPDTMHDPFDSIDSWALLFSAYYGEFLIVSIIAAFFPLIAFAYGLFVFIAYLAEFTGYHFLTRLLPQYGSQNVMGRLLAIRPQRLVIVTAHYDTGSATWLSERTLVRWLPWIHAGIVLLMLLILISCAAEGMLEFSGPWLAATLWIRWTAAAVLVTVALFLLLNDRAGVETRGAVDNASGVAAMLALGQRLRENPPETTEVLFLATGSMAAGLNGIHHFLRHQDLDRDLTYFLNLDSVGAGRLAYTRAEGMLHVFRSSPEWTAHAERVASQFRARPFTLRAVPSDMLVPLARGYKAVSIMGVDERGVPPFWRSPDDTAAQVDAEQIVRAAGFAEALIRSLDESA